MEPNIHSDVDMTSSDSRLPLYQRLHDQLLEKIVAREWQPGDAIPTENELTEAYQVSIGTVRKAVDLLVAEGLLERNQGRGTFLRRPNFNTSLFRFFRHQGVDGTYRVPQGRILARNLEVPPEPVASKLELGRNAKAIRLDRLRLMEGKPVLLEEIWLPLARFRPLMAIEPAEFGDLLYPLYEEKCGQTIAIAQETLTVEAADADVAEKLQIGLGEPVVAIDRLALGYDRHPLEWRRSKGPASRFRYQVEIR